LGVLVQRRRIRSNARFARPIFARILTFENALGCQGAAILGSVELRSCLVNLPKALSISLVFHDVDGFDGVSTFGKRKQNIAVLRKKYHSFQSGKNMLGLKQLFVQ
jgi:8-amino-7-oxononanoate synthase